MRDDGTATALRSPHAGLWGLDPGVLYLNHGSFGACPKAVLDYQTDLRARMEREPADFMLRSLPGMMAETRVSLGRFVGADPEGIAFVANATTGVNAALASWELGPGDEILATDHAYGACRKAAAFVAPRRGARLVTASVPFPITGDDDVIEPVLAAVTPRTRVALLDHVTSPTALVFPVHRLVEALRERGVESIIDGAHALGMVPLELDALGAACYTANAHKWLCAPKGAAFLHVRADMRERIRPTVISHGYDPARGSVRFRDEWDWTGTDDPTPWLSIPECLRLLSGVLPGGWPALMEHNHRLALNARRILLDALGGRPACPDGMIGSIASVLLPAAEAGSPVARLDVTGLTDWARERGIESWFFPWEQAGATIVRLSAQLYNTDEQYRRLASLLTVALRAG